jgi:hypothetical protein
MPIVKVKSNETDRQSNGLCCYSACFAGRAVAGPYAMISSTGLRFAPVSRTRSLDRELSRAAAPHAAVTALQVSRTSAMPKRPSPSPESNRFGTDCSLGRQTKLCPGQDQMSACFPYRPIAVSKGLNSRSRSGVAARGNIGCMNSARKWRQLGGLDGVAMDSDGPRDGAAVALHVADHLDDEFQALQFPEDFSLQPGR